MFAPICTDVAAFFPLLEPLYSLMMRGVAPSKALRIIKDLFLAVYYTTSPSTHSATQHHDGPSRPLLGVCRRNAYNRLPLQSAPCVGGQTVGGWYVGVQPYSKVCNSGG
jgi:hypothetical protein